ncbi:MAG: DUF362 domain-containing protein [Bacteroidales bacterium]|nr:DUF362 domain-containing protein [Bacteroidales bacterium]
MGFVNIVTVFSNSAERNISHLSMIYENKSLLKKKILSAGRGILDNAEIITKKKILIKPNWVWHNHNQKDEICLRTHHQFLLATVEIVAEKKPASIVIGDAPIQGCEWNKVVDSDFLDKIDKLRKIYSIPILIQDFRRVTFDPDKNNPVFDRRDMSNYTIFDLKEKSYLESISNEKPIFRVTSYNPDKLAMVHSLGIHKYCIANELFESDVVISIPKLKTHQKTGITGAMKNLVGVNGDKDYLPHHRIGGDKNGGDCYPGKNIMRLWAEKALDNANRNQGKKVYWFWYFMSRIIWKMSLPTNVQHLSASWYGNDTCWRMVMDLNQIAVFGKKNGELSNKVEREVFSLCDGIIGGQGDGPLHPDPLALGLITFTNNSRMNDKCISIMMGFDPEKFPLITSRDSGFKNVEDEHEITLDGNPVTTADLKIYSIPTMPPPGWKDYLTL